MEVNSPPKRLHRHALPVAMVAAALLALPVIVFSRYNTTSLPAEGGLARGLVTRVLYVRPTSNGLAKISLDNPAANKTASAVGLDLNGYIAQAGRSVQLSLELNH
jgi:hypothetical protein